MNFAFGILTHTPLWVWLILAGLIYLGLKRTRTRELTVSRILLPAALFGLVAAAKLALGHFAAAALYGSASGLVAALLLLLAVKPGRGARRISADTLVVQGEWFSLALILAIFSVNYAIAVVSAIDPMAAASIDVRFLYGFVNATSASFMIGRAFVYLKARPA